MFKLGGPVFKSLAAVPKSVSSSVGQSLLGLIVWCPGDIKPVPSARKWGHQQIDFTQKQLQEVAHSDQLYRDVFILRYQNREKNRKIWKKIKYLVCLRLSATGMQTGRTPVGSFFESISLGSRSVCFRLYQDRGQLPEICCDWDRASFCLSRSRAVCYLCFLQKM